MSIQLFLLQVLNGLQFGILLFLMAAGLTLVFGIMNFVNLAHGSFYMFGAYFAALIFAQTGSFALAVGGGIGGLFLMGVILDRLAFSILHHRDHLDQVLATFGFILLANEAVRLLWGNAPIYMDVPEWLSNPVDILGFSYSSYRFAIILVGIMVAIGLHLLIDRTRIGMLIRAGASNPLMVASLGVNIGWLTTFIFALGAALAGLAGAIVGPILSVQPGMGEPVLILTLVVIVIGGIGSIRGAMFGALVVGIVDTLGRSLLPGILYSIFGPGGVATAGAAAASVGVYLLMALILVMKPEGLFPVRY